MQSKQFELIQDLIMHLYIDVHNFVIYLDDYLTNYYIVLQERQIIYSFCFCCNKRSLPNTVKVALIIKLLQKFSFGRSEKTGDKI
jgi:hypothetical protein